MSNEGRGEFDNEIEPLAAGVDASSMNGFDQFVAAGAWDQPDQQYIDDATDLLNRLGGNTQFSLSIILAIAGLLMQLFSYFKTHKVARYLVKRAAARPNGLAALVVHRKIRDRLPQEVKDVPNIPDGLTQLTDTALVKAGV